MPGGKGKLNGAEDGTPFSKEYQPKNRRKPAKWLTEMLIKESKKKRDVVMEGMEMVDGYETGRKVKVKIPMPSAKTIIQAHLRQAAKGNMIAIQEYYNRIEGKAPQPISGDSDNPISVILKAAEGCEPMKEE